MIARVAVFGAVCGLAACAAGSRSEQAAGLTADTVTAVGIVRVTGAEPLTQLVLLAEGREPTALVGPLQSELRQTVGLEVRVTGIPVDPTPPARVALDVSAYEALSINGTPAYIGVLEQSGDGLQLVSAMHRWTLLNPPTELRQAVGAKVWVAGHASDQGLSVSAYGIITAGS